MKVNLGVIGIGMAWERLHYPAIVQMTDKYSIAGLYDSVKQKALDFVAKNNMDASIVSDNLETFLSNPNIDTVLVAVPIYENYEIAKCVLEAGKNLIAEKPLSATIEGAEELIRLSESKNLKLMVAENYRFNEESTIIRDIVSKNEIGDIVYFINNNVTDFEKSMNEDTFAAKEWRHHPEFYGGAFLDSAIHDIARLRYIFGNVISVYATARPHEKDFNEFASVHAHLYFESGISGYYTYYCTGVETVKPPVGLRIFGTNGEIFLEDKNIGRIILAKKNELQQDIPFTPDMGYYNEFDNFYNVLACSHENKCPPRLEIEDIKLIMGILEAARDKKVVTL